VFVWCGSVDDGSSVSEVSDNDTDDDSETTLINTCSDCHSTSELSTRSALYWYWRCTASIQYCDIPPTRSLCR